MLRNAAHIRLRLARAMQSRIRAAEVVESIPVSLTAWAVDGEPVPFTTAITQDFAPIAAGTPWGPSWSSLWLRVNGDVPAAWRGRRVELVIELGFSDQGVGFQTEGMAYTPSGSPIKAINPMSRWVPIGAPVDGGEVVDVVIEAASNPTLLPNH